MIAVSYSSFLRSCKSLEANFFYLKKDHFNSELIGKLDLYELIFTKYHLHKQSNSLYYNDV